MFVCFRFWGCLVGGFLLLEGCSFSLGFCSGFCVCLFFLCCLVGWFCVFERAGWVFLFFGLGFFFLLMFWGCDFY